MSVVPALPPRPDALLEHVPHRDARVVLAEPDPRSPASSWPAASPPAAGTGAAGAAGGGERRRAVRHLWPVPPAPQPHAGPGAPDPGGSSQDVRPGIPDALEAPGATRPGGGRHDGLATPPAPLGWVRTRPPDPAGGDVGRSAVLVVRVLLEVLSGDRPPAQLRALSRPDLWTAGPGLIGQHRPRPWAGSIRRVLVRQPRPGAAEVAAIIDLGARVAALALRLELEGARWLLTDLAIGL